MARVEVPMPQMGESIAEGTVSVWLKKVGDEVQRDEPIMEISTDKVDAEIPAPIAGVLAEVVVSEGQTVEVGTIVAYIETEAGAVASPAPPVPSAPEGEQQTTLPAAAAGEVERPQGAGVSAGGTADVIPTAGALASADGSSAQGGSGDGAASEEERLRTRSTPLVRKIAAEHGVEVAAVHGTGRAGRVTKEDILRHVQEAQTVRAAPAQPSRLREPAPSAQSAPTAAGPGFSWDEFYSHVQHPTVAAGPRDRAEPIGRMTSIIAEHMVLSRRISPHVHSFFEVDYSRLDQVRARNRGVWEQQGVKVTYTHFIARAVAMALREFPKLNASVSGDQVIYRGEVNLGVAVALENGLIVPVVRNADELSLVGLARRINDLAGRARAKKLSPEEVQGGTFTITNPGIFGTTIGFPIINQPQVAILGVGGVEKRAVVVTDEYGHDAIVARKRGYMSLGFDHRLVNGADGDQFLARVKQILETFPEDAG